MKTARAAVRDAVYCPQQGVFYFQNVMQSYGTDVHVTVFMVQTYVTVFTVQTYTSLYLRYRRTRHCIYGTDVRHCIYGTDVHVTIFTYRRKERPRPGRLSRNSPALNSVMRLSVIPTSARRGPKHGECGQKLLRGTFV